MEDLNVVDSINGAGSWLVANQALLLSYAVNIVAALAIIIVGLDVYKRQVRGRSTIDKSMILLKMRCTLPHPSSSSKETGYYWMMKSGRSWHLSAIFLFLFMHLLKFCGSA